MYACPGDHATLECQFDANPPATLTWGKYELDENNELKFYSVDVSMTSEGEDVSYLQVIYNWVFIHKYSIMFNNSHSSCFLNIQLNTEEEAAYDVYTCLATNSIGEKEANASLIPATLPSQPTNLQVSLQHS